MLPWVGELAFAFRRGATKNNPGHECNLWRRQNHHQRESSYYSCQARETSPVSRCRSSAPQHTEDHASSGYKWVEHGPANSPEPADTGHTCVYPGGRDSSHSWHSKIICNARGTNGH